MHVVAGQSEAVRRRGRQLYRAAWGVAMVRRASLVVAAMEGGPALQTWENLGRALETATSLVEDGGAIAVCCDLAANPGPAVQQMAGARSRAAALRRIGKHPPEDALPAAQLARALDRGKVYLLSRLAPSLVEELDVIPIAGGEELARLARQHKSYILLANAPHAMVTANEDD
jgi:nickel-dependent lactate racemase